MPEQNRIVRPSRKERTVLSETGEELTIPAKWALLPPGDGPLTKLVKAKGVIWLVRVKFKNRFISKGIWADKQHIESARTELAAKRSAPGYAQKRKQQVARKEQKQLEYIEEFYQEILQFLNFHPRYNSLAEQLARSVAEHSTPVGSGTVARTTRIPVEDRARSAVIAWMRHHTTSYDRMTIAPVKGRRRQVRRELASQSIGLMQPYRDGDDMPSSCPLQKVFIDAEKSVEQKV